MKSIKLSQVISKLEEKGLYKSAENVIYAVKSLGILSERDKVISMSMKNFKDVATLQRKMSNYIVNMVDKLKNPLRRKLKSKFEGEIERIRKEVGQEGIDSLVDMLSQGFTPINTIEVIDWIK